MADNRGSQELGGFKMGGSAFSVCRHCLGTTADIQTKVCCVHTFHFLSVMTCIPMRSTFTLQCMNNVRTCDKHCKSFN